MKIKPPTTKARKTPARRAASAKPKRRAPAKKKTAAKPARTPRRPGSAGPKSVPPEATVSLPAILLEGDRPKPSLVSGPGEKFALGPTPPAQQFEGQTSELPEAYGTKRLFLTARDPHWLYASWDLTREQQARCNQQSADGHLVVRIFHAPPAGGLVLEVHVHPESRHWFVHVERAATKYAAELGFYSKKRQWKSIAVSGTTLTPPETISDDASVEFATIPVDVPFEKLLALVKEAVQENRPLARAVEDLRREGHPELPRAASAPDNRWTPEQERALAEVVSLDQVRRVWIGSLEITELIHRRLEREISSRSVSQFGLPTSPGGAVSSVSSPFGGEQARAKGFWFNVNAELIVYGATERDATVTIGGRKIKLRADGSFTYRFALPDGRYDLPAVAVSADETDGRGAELKFTRTTEHLGEVGAHPQDPALKTPTPDNV